MKQFCLACSTEIANKFCKSNFKSMHVCKINRYCSKNTYPVRFAHFLLNSTPFLLLIHDSSQLYNIWKVQHSCNYNHVFTQHPTVHKFLLPSTLHLLHLHTWKEEQVMLYKIRKKFQHIRDCIHMNRHIQWKYFLA